MNVDKIQGELHYINGVLDGLFAAVPKPNEVEFIRKECVDSLSRVLAEVKAVVAPAKPEGDEAKTVRVCGLKELRDGWIADVGTLVDRINKAAVHAAKTGATIPPKADPARPSDPKPAPLKVGDPVIISNAVARVGGYQGVIEVCSVWDAGDCVVCLNGYTPTVRVVVRAEHLKKV